MRKLLLLSCLLPTLALGAPPLPGTEDHAILSPHSEWIRGLFRGHISCCDMADGRPVSARIHGNEWQVKFRPGQLDGAPLDWTNVPPDAVLRVPNPVGMPIAFWYNSQIMCFIPASTF
jgi:hypothetical protein